MTLEDSALVLKGALLSLPLLFSILSVDSQATYQNFLKMHLDPNRTAPNPHNYCAEIMSVRGLTSHTCLRQNIFIHAAKIDVKGVCGARGEFFQDTCFDSLASFFLTTCQSDGGSPPKSCRYRGQSERRRIRVSCVRGVPVRFRSILISGLEGSPC